MRRTSSLRPAWVAGGILLGVVLTLVLLAAAPAIFFRLVGLAGVALMVLSVLAMVVTCRLAKRVNVMSQVVPVATSLVTVLLFAALVKAPVTSGGVTTFLLIGVLAGGGWAVAGNFSESNGQVRMAGTSWHLLIWAGVFALNQCVALIGGRGPATMMLLLFLSLGVIFGRSGVTLVRYVRFRAERP